MAMPNNKFWIDPAVRVAAAGLGGAVAGPLGAVLGGWMGSALGGPAAAIILEYSKKFGEKAGEKLLDVGAGSLCERLKATPPQIEGAYRESLRLALAEVRSQVFLQDFQDWFENWDCCLAASLPLDLSTITVGHLTPEELGTLFRRTMERLDSQGTAIRHKDLSLTLKSRAMPEALFSELTARLPEPLERNFRILIVTSEYEQGWKQMQMIFQQFVDSTLHRIEEKTQAIDLRTQVLPQVAEDTTAIRKELADFRNYITQQIIHQAAVRQQKSWRDLSHLLIPMLAGDHESSDQFFLAVVNEGLEQTFGNRPYTQFTGVLRYVERDVQGTIVPAYYIICHEIEFCEYVRNKTHNIILSRQKAKKEGPEVLERLKQEQQEITDRLNEWNAYSSFGLSSVWQPLEFVLDPAKRIISISALPMSLDPSVYASGLNSTSDMLRFLASYANASGPFAYFGDANWYDGNYALLKLWADLIDHRKIDLERIRINAENYEEWDYLNPVVDLEIKRAEKRAATTAQ
jgi:hypothetical protein